MISKKLSILASIIITSCTTHAPVDYQYYRTKANVSVKLTKIITCTPDGLPITTIASPEIVTTYSADDSKPPLVFHAEKTTAIGSDTTSSMSWTSDYRLKGINMTNHGHGKEIVAAIVSSVKTLALIAGGGTDINQKNKKKLICNYVKRMGSNNSLSVTFQYKMDITPDTTNSVYLESLSQPGAVESLNALYSDRRFNPTLTFPRKSKYAISPVTFTNEEEQNKHAVALPLQKIHLVTLQIVDEGSPVAESTILVPGDEIYYIPVPKAALFGDTSFTLNTTPAVAPETISYSNLDKTAETIIAGNDAANLLTPQMWQQNEIDRANREREMIKANEKLAACLATPKDCN
ncbi:TPA: hypothetical protein I9281_002476 [Serratia marcescens]|nr:hypothetical protein [Serratia marcescens]